VPEFLLAARNVFLRRRRYALLSLAIILGFALVTFIQAATNGALQSIKDKAARYFSGHISITGYDKGEQSLEAPEQLAQAILDSGLPVRSVAKRSIYYDSNASLFFGGNSVRQRRLVGIDFAAEREQMQTLDFSEGSLEVLLADESNGILISEAAARILGARVGDDLMLFLTTPRGQYNTATLYVRGIFRETSLFGYVAYMNLKDMNRVLNRPEESATDLAIYAEPGVNHQRLLDDLRGQLGTAYRLLPPMANKQQLSAELSKVDWKQGPVLAPLTLDAHLEQITTILDAILAVTWFVLTVFISIVMVGVLNTYRVLVYERTREIGTIRAIGMGRNAVRLMFLWEAVLLGLAATLIGLVVGRVLLLALRLVDLSAITGAGMFTVRGHLVPQLNTPTTLLTFALMLLALVLAVWGPAAKAARVAPAEALRTED